MTAGAWRGASVEILEFRRRRRRRAPVVLDQLSPSAPRPRRFLWDVILMRALALAVCVLGWAAVIYLARHGGRP
ncbi:MAG: hypothetical protein P4L73_03465 [Caulobacteraceae bacterium]|nr:hypothetical protein [Caulobacteraceae bacterium]